jgi:hypothetical protein
MGLVLRSNSMNGLGLLAGFARCEPSAYWPDLLIASLQHIGRICSLRAFSTSAGFARSEPSAHQPEYSLRAFSTSAGILIASLPFSLPELVITTTALQLCFKTPVGPIIGNLRFKRRFKTPVGTNKSSECRVSF